MKTENGRVVAQIRVAGGVTEMGRVAPDRAGLSGGGWLVQVGRAIGTRCPGLRTD
jgi:hypothetical protein